MILTKDMIKIKAIPDIETKKKEGKEILILYKKDSRAKIITVKLVIRIMKILVTSMTKNIYQETIIKQKWISKLIIIRNHKVHKKESKVINVK